MHRTPYMKKESWRPNIQQRRHATDKGHHRLTRLHRMSLQSCCSEKETWTHPDQKPVVCKICGKSFTQKAYIQKHSLIHTGQKPYECKACGKAFTQKGNLQRHSLIHTGQKPYECKVCGK